MYSHTFVSVSDFDRALAFYRAVMRELGLAERFCDAAKPWAGWHTEGGQRPYFVICKPYDGGLHHPGNGQMVAFLAHSRDQVRRVHAAALAAGGRTEGEPR